jgi:hypothetical protein
LVHLTQACSATNDSPSNSTNLSEDFVGYWANVNPQYNNWWEIKSDSVINYGTQKNKECSPSEANILSKDSIDVTFGNRAIVDLTIVDDLLVFTHDGGFSAHKRVSPEDICLSSKYVYYKGAPYPLEFESPEDVLRAISQSHIDANMPPEDKFHLFLKRDLKAYANDNFEGLSTDNLQYSMLGMKQIAVGWPRVYLMVQFDSPNDKERSGILSAIAMNQNEFVVEHFFSLSSIEMDNKAVRKALPSEVFEWIKRRKN